MVSAVDMVDAMGADAAVVEVEGEPKDVTDVFVWGDDMDVPEGAIVAAVGVVDENAQRAIFETAADAGAGAIFLRRPVGTDAIEVASNRRLTVCTLDPAVGWADVVFLVRALLQRPAADTTPHQELFALADAVAATLSASVTIEDARHRVLAYAAPAGMADLARTSTILGRAVPPDVLRRLRSAGVLRRLSTTDDPFVVPSVGAELQQRLVVPVRLSARPLGSIWVAMDGDLTPAVRDELATAAARTARLMLSIMAREDIVSRISASVVRRALRDGDDAARVMRDVEPAGLPVRVAVLHHTDQAPQPGDVVLWRAVMRRHGWAQPVMADIDGQLFMVVHDRPGPGGWEWLTEIAARDGSVVVAASRASAAPDELVAMRREAVDVCVALRGGLAAARYEDVWGDVVVARATAVVSRRDRAWVERLTSTETGATDVLAATTLAWLLSWGDVARTARDLGVHPNTVRQRLRKARSVVPNVDLDAPADRLAATLLLLAGVAGAGDDDEPQPAVIG